MDQGRYSLGAGVAPNWLTPEGARDAPALYHPGAVLEAHLPTFEGELHGAGPIIEFLAARWPPGARVNAFAERVTPGGVQLRLEVALDDAVLLRERHLLHARDGRIAWHVVYPEKVPVVLSAEALAEPGESAAGLPVVSRTPMPPGFSGAPLERLVLDDGRSLVVKHVAPRWSWVMRATRDDGREARIWTGTGYRPGDEVDPAVVSVARLADRWLVYMEDVSEFVSGPSSDLLPSLSAFYDAAPPDEPPGLCPLARRLGLFAPATARSERRGSDLGPKIIGRGWELIRDLIPRDLFELAHGLASDPAPLAAALHQRRCAVLHGDLRPGNVGLRGARIVLLDWGLVTWGPPALDLTWYMFNRGWPDDASEIVHDSLGRWGDRDALDLAVVATFIQACPYFGFNVVQEVDPEARRRAAEQLKAWVERVSDSLERTGPGTP
ncbi:MAG: phosphotransferase [Actinomycetota bacterium]